ncbi:choline ABC transporter permease, partial [Peribacillus frigoritolerans]|nr:choline ABC transporter permease [Peribacillus frigoritolerans]
METMLDFLQTNSQELIYKAWEHLYISMIAVFIGIIVAVPLGIMLTRMKRSASII